MVELQSVTMGIRERILKCIHSSTDYTVYVVYSMNITLGKLEPIANWQIFSLVDWVILSVDCLTDTHNTCNYRV